MRHLAKAAMAGSVLVLGLAGGVLAQDTFKPDPKSSFFVTSVGLGKGADLGGLAGADAHCADLAKAAGLPGKSWRAYLSTSKVNAKDRIGKGPWYNVKGVMVAANVADLHSPNNKLNKENSLSEKGGTINGIGDTPNTHDMLTGTNDQGTLQAPIPIAAPPGSPPGTPPGAPPEDMTCHDWTASTGNYKAMLGHLDRKGAGPSGPSWVAAHASRGCSQPELVVSGGAGLYYCFAAN